MKNLLHPNRNMRDLVSLGGTRPLDEFSKYPQQETRPEAGFHLSLLTLLLTLCAATSGFSALAPTEWSQRQSLPVATSGLVKVAVPATTFDANLPGLSDLRLIDAAGQELPFLLDTPPLLGEEERQTRSHRPQSFVTTLGGDDASEIMITTGTTERIEAVDLESSAPFFLKAAHIDISTDGKEWQSLGAAVPLFRQFGAEQLRLALNGQPAAFVRVTLDDSRSRPVTFTGARILRTPAEASPPPLVPLGATITRRDEFAGETVLTVTLDGRHVPLAALTFATKDPLFMRRVTVAVREVHGTVSTEHTVGSGTLYRVALNGAPVRAQLELPIEFTPLTRELLVHFHNGDSPPLTIDGVQARQHPINLLFMAPAAGNYTLLSGNPQVAAPRYDLAAFAGEMRGTTAAAVTPGPLEAMPNYRPGESPGPAPLPDVPLTGAPLDTKEWTHRQPIQITRVGVQELELNLTALAQAQPDFSDLRLLHAGNQIPYVLEQPALARSLTLTPVAAPDAKRPTVSVWCLSLPQASLPLRRLVLASSTPLFQRQFRLYEKLTNQNGVVRETTLAGGPWSRTPEPGVPENRIFELSEQPSSDTLWIETDNGDNPAIALNPIQVVYPVVRLVFKTAETDGFTLAYGNKQAHAPRYDLSLVAVKLLTASRQVAQLPADMPKTVNADSKAIFPGIDNTHIFWAALALVVVVLLVVVAKLLPKPPTG